MLAFWEGAWLSLCFGVAVSLSQSISRWGANRDRERTHRQTQTDRYKKRQGRSKRYKEREIKKEI